MSQYIGEALRTLHWKDYGIDRLRVRGLMASADLLALY